MALAQRLEQDLKTALRAGDAVRVSTIRLARAAIHNEEIEHGRQLSDDEIRVVLRKEAKRRREAIEMFERGSRDDLVAKESLELAIITEYLPAAMSPEELRKIVAEGIAEVRATARKDTGKVMAFVMPRVAGRADGQTVNRIVQEMLPE
ncbi:MAG: GatB/YqeY domain-containing protein [bacterium]